MLLSWRVAPYAPLLAAAFGLVLSPGKSMGGGSGLNVVVVVNQRHPDSVELGNYFCEKRAVPPQNVVRITSWTGGNITWNRAECQSHLVQPLVSALADRKLTNQIDYVLLSMGIPYQVWDATGVNSTTSLLFYGFRPDDGTSTYGPSCTLPDEATNKFAFAEDMFRSVSPLALSGPSFLATMITADNLAAARKVVDSGVSGDGSFPSQVAWLVRTSDGARSVRHELFDNAIFDARIRGSPTIVRTNLDSPALLTNMLGLQTGRVRVDLAPDAFVPGAMADNLTSFGGMLFLDTGHTTLLSFLAAGAAGSYGTVIEPCNYTAKFPNPENYFYQARGFSIAECYYMSIAHPRQGLIVAEPLSAPFASPGTGAWAGLSEGAALSGITNLALNFIACSPDRPLQKVDLFIDGTFLHTITNIAPARGNVLSLALNGHTIRHTVRSGATVKSVTSALTDVLNAPSNTNATKVIAYGYGDRIELQALDPLKTGESITLTAVADAGSASAITAQIKAGRPHFIDSIAEPRVSLAVSNLAAQGDWLQLDIIKTNGNRFTFARTNSSSDGTLSDLVLGIYHQIRNSPELRLADGVEAEDYGSAENTGKPFAGFSIRARSPGPGSIGIQAIWAGSKTFAYFPKRTNRLDENLGDLRPRNHVYIAAGVTNLSCTYSLDTTTLPDGFHEITAIAYEGNHVRTQTRATRTVHINNTSLRGELSFGMGDTNVAAECALPFAVAANTADVDRIELFSTGGLVASVSNRPTAEFSVPGTQLGAGFHPFYAVVTASTGRQYRTKTIHVRLIGAESPFQIAASGAPLTIRWPAVPFRRYRIAATDRLDLPFSTIATVVPDGKTGVWTDPFPGRVCRYYRVFVSD